jgi:hypothetical protein
MSWETPNLSKGDVELIVVALDEYLYNSDEEVLEKTKLERIVNRLDDHLSKF